MSSRNDILSKVQHNQPELITLPDLPSFANWFTDPVAKFTEVLSLIGGDVLPVAMQDIEPIIKNLYPEAVRIVSSLPGLAVFAEIVSGLELPHTFQNVDVAILKGQFGVAENGAIWIAEKDITERVLPFITQNLVLLLDKQNIVSTMHEAYERIGLQEYGYGTFIAGPSKTADIEQSLVLGAHGPKSMTVLLTG